MAVKVLNELVTTTLTIEFTADGVSTKVNADRTPSLTMYKDGVALFTKEGADVYNYLTGTYKVTWTPTATGEYEAVWSFIVSTISYSQAEAIFVLDPNGCGLVPDETVPDIGTSNTCRITATFIDAAGNYKKGVLVRFSPITAQQEHSLYGYIANDVTAESNADGALSMTLVRNMFGLLTITGVGIVRRVTIPDQETIDLFELAAEGDDALSVQTPVFVTLPRRSP